MFNEEFCIAQLLNVFTLIYIQTEFSYQSKSNYTEPIELAVLTSTNSCYDGCNYCCFSHLCKSMQIVLVLFHFPTMLTDLFHNVSFMI